jgi:ABC-type uncharacterized transport system permease subunit
MCDKIYITVHTLQYDDVCIEIKSGVLVVYVCVCMRVCTCTSVCLYVCVSQCACVFIYGKSSVS